MSQFWDHERLIKSIDKNDRGGTIKIKWVKKESHEYIDVRNFYIKNGEELPGKGISIPVNLADEIALTIMDATSKEGK